MPYTMHTFIQGTHRYPRPSDTMGMVVTDNTSIILGIKRLDASTICTVSGDC